MRGKKKEFLYPGEFRSLENLRKNGRELVKNRRLYKGGGGKGEKSAWQDGGLLVWEPSCVTKFERSRGYFVMGLLGRPV